MATLSGPNPQAPRLAKVDVMRNLAELNINEGGRLVRRAPPTERAITEVENLLGYRLPLEYVQLLRHANGGHPELDSLLPGEKGKDADWVVAWFLHIDESTMAHPANLWAAIYAWRPILGEKALPIALDPFGNVFFMNMNESPPGVHACIHDEEFRTVPVAPSFESFIDSLGRNPDLI